MGPDVTLSLLLIPIGIRVSIPYSQWLSWGRSICLAV
jgi:hypothetical protein